MPLVPSPVLGYNAVTLWAQEVIMAKTAELKLRIDPDLKESVSGLYRQWGLNLSDAVTIFFNQSVACGGLPFRLRQPVGKERLNRQHPGIIPIDQTLGHPLLPEDWDEEEDAFYDKL
jgi:DNA-damage-inducible protein J